MRPSWWTRAAVTMDGTMSVELHVQRTDVGVVDGDKQAQWLSSEKT